MLLWFTPHPSGVTCLKHKRMLLTQNGLVQSVPLSQCFHSKNPSRKQRGRLQGWIPGGGNEDFDSCSQAHASVAPGVWNPSHSKSVPKVVCRLEDLALNLLTVWSCIFSLSQVTLLPSNPAPGLDFSELFQIPEHSRLVRCRQYWDSCFKLTCDSDKTC